MTTSSNHSAPIVTRGGEAPQIETAALQVRFLLEAKHGGAFSVCEFCAAPGFSGPPIPHHHTREEASFLVLEGKLAITIGGTEHVVGPGDLVHLPRAIDFVWRNASSSEPARFISVYCPAGFEQMFADVARSVGDRAPTPEVLRELMPPLWQKYGIGVSRG
jgi:quercetin dioxygenase-like cupin family protein